MKVRGNDVHLGKFSTQTEAKIAIDEHHSKSDEVVKATKAVKEEKKTKKIQDSSSESKEKNQSGLNKSDRDGDDGDSECEYKQKDDERESESDTDFEEDENNLGDSSNDKVWLPLSEQKNTERARRSRH